MATNEVLKPGYRRERVVSSPASPVSGDPCRIGKETGVAMESLGAGGAAATGTVVDTGPGVYNMSVKDNLGTGIAVGDLIYFHDAGTPRLNNDPASADAFFGFAEGAVSANATTTIKVTHATAAVATAVADGALSAAILGSADGLGVLRVARMTWNPSAVAGDRTVAAHASPSAVIPINAIVCGGFQDVVTAVTSTNSTATVAVSVEGAGDIQAAAAVSGAPYSTTGKKAIVPKANTPESTGIKTTAARAVTVTVAVEAVLLGKVEIFLFYVQSS